MTVLCAPYSLDSCSAGVGRAPFPREDHALPAKHPPALRAGSIRHFQFWGVGGGSHRIGRKLFEDRRPPRAAGDAAFRSFPSSTLRIITSLPHPAPTVVRCRANVAHIRQSKPDFGLGFQVKVLESFTVVPSSLGRGLVTPWSLPGTLWVHGESSAINPTPYTLHPTPYTLNLKP